MLVKSKEGKKTVRDYIEYIVTHDTNWLHGTESFLRS
jgi:hypothetical protein